MDPKEPKKLLVKEGYREKLQHRFTQSSVAFYLGSSMVGVVRTLIGFPFEHPLDSIKTQWQAKPYLKNELAIIKDVYASKGLKGFYAGALPNMARCLLKNTYRYPLMVGLPQFYNSRLPNNIKENKNLLRLLTGTSIALVEATLTCPIERLKVFFMTTQDKISYKEFFASNRSNLFRELFRGYTPLFMRQSMAWVIFLQTDLMVKQAIRKIYAIPTNKEISTKYLIPASIVVALVNTGMVMPFDCVKTHMEKRDPTSTYVQTFGNIYRQAGITGFFTGYRLRFLLYFSNALFTVNLLEKLESIAAYLKHHNK